MTEQPATDIRSFSTLMMNLYLYPIGGWAVLLGGLFVAGMHEIALPLCYPLAVWLAGLTLYWGVQANRRVREGDLTRAEVDAGVVSIGHILAGAGAMPAIVFLTDNPLAPQAWSTAVGIFVVCGLCWLGVSQLVKVSRWYTGALALALAWSALPVNTTGAVTAAMMIGWYEQTVDELGIEFLKLNLAEEVE